MFDSAQWPMVWTGFLMIAVSVRLAVTVRGYRHRRTGPARRPSHLEWLPGLAGLIGVVGAGPRVLRASDSVLVVTDDLAGAATGAVLVLLLYGAVVLLRRQRG
ncbi:hypothetical protein C7C46_18255 [Streptomyces tateyamensis]|uniref:Uncharacterized protein n=1 Tax=Streptomyces tateyamensis TaxID=565073 RepID=A0A2V4N1C4_9ACTN|nr:hypothetical protein [Streptomyces tateyamensis]PYC77579.1 hypothetical protein C7C46_18255 [Streptomyces tateyamensis]